MAIPQLGGWFARPEVLDRLAQKAGERPENSGLRTAIEAIRNRQAQAGQQAASGMKRLSDVMKNVRPRAAGPGGSPLLAQLAASGQFGPAGVDETARGNLYGGSASGGPYAGPMGGTSLGAAMAGPQYGPMAGQVAAGGAEKGTGAMVKAPNPWQVVGAKNAWDAAAGAGYGAPPGVADVGQSFNPNTTIGGALGQMGRAIGGGTMRPQPVGPRMEYQAPGGAAGPGQAMTVPMVGPDGDEYDVPAELAAEWEARGARRRES